MKINVGLACLSGIYLSFFLSYFTSYWHFPHLSLWSVFPHCLTRGMLHVREQKPARLSDFSLKRLNPRMGRE